MADGRGKLELIQEKTTRSGRSFRPDTGAQRRASTSGPSGPSGLSGAAPLQVKPKGMSSEDVLALALGKINESLENLSKQVAETNKQVAEALVKIDQNTTSINNLGQKVNTNTETIEKLLQESALTRKTAEEAKDIATATEEKIPPIYRQLEDHRLTLSMIELKEKQTYLGIRAVPELEKDNLIDFLTQVFADFWQQDLGEEEFKIVSAFRLGRGGRRNKVRDCLITLRTKEERDKILNLHFRKTLEIHESSVEIFKDIPKHLLDLRFNYGDLVALLRSNRIIFRWEFPQGLSFKYKGRKIKIRSVDDKDRFLKDHGEDLQKEVESGEEPKALERGILDIANLSFGLHGSEKVTPPTEQEQTLGAVGGKAK
ncbi:Hypothetical predicted protein [Podarcis lilfordi]|uniref:L1 transposable element RRM domain-containing protein n=1 Tax=Podarcis lilfordi TaxID=74358 RepID=A0AA35KF23_9SAUR|nr:Hypothetical predicted protein [Podarcis lilfordi]